MKIRPKNHIPAMDAIQYTGENASEVEKFLGGNIVQERVTLSWNTVVSATLKLFLPGVIFTDRDVILHLDDWAILLPKAVLVRSDSDFREIYEVVE